MNKGKQNILKVVVFLCAVFAALSWQVSAKETKVSAKTYVMKPSTSSKRYKGSSKYTKYTKTYFAIRERMEKIEKEKKGTIVFKKGTYSLSNTIFVPSNTTIIFKDGVKFTKGKKTGKKGWKAASSMFQLIKPSKSGKSKVYGKYNGMKNITFKGEGNATIDMKNFYKGIAIITGHNQNVTITGLRFKNMYTGHFVEMDATKNISITNCKFYNGKGYTKKEAINLDTPDKQTGGYSQKWSKFDKTANYKVNIEDCYFSNMGRAIGTHQYSGGKYHSYVTIKNCTMKNMKEDAIRMMNWNRPVVTDNYIDTVKYSGHNAILGSGLKYPTIKNNTFKNIPAKAMLIAPWKNTNKPANKYAITYNTFSQANYEDLAKNEGINVHDNYVKIAWKYKHYATKECKIINLVGKEQ